jgi:hypothetical protein
MTARTLATFSTAFVGIACAAGLTLAACSSTTDRAPFSEDAPSPTTPAQTPEQNGAPVKAPPSGPETIENDASVAPDAPDTCKRTAPSNKCGLAPQCGCTLAETCTVADTSGNVECVVAGKAPMGGACLATAGCAVGLTCISGACHPYCGNPGSACTAPKTGACIQINGSGGVAVPNLSICLVSCDLRDVNACGGTTAAGTGVCVVDGDNQTDCVMGGTHTAGQACSPTEECGPGHVCTVTGTATTGTCKKWCRVGTNDCGGTTVCNGFGTKVIVAGVEHGACP